MTGWIHPGIGVILLAAHAVFFFRARAMRRRDGRPRGLDRAARNISHFGLPLAVASGFLTATAGTTDVSAVLVLHIILGLAPLAAILVFTPFLSLKRRIPWLLPAINLALFASAVLTGFLI